MVFVGLLVEFTRIADGGGTVDFDEFYTWWSNPENHGAKASKLSSMRLALTTQHLKERTSAIAKSMNDALAKGKGTDHQW